MTKAFRLTHAGHVACHAAQALHGGYTVVDSATSPACVATIDRRVRDLLESTPFDQGTLRPDTLKRLGYLLGRVPEVEWLVLNRLVRDIVDVILTPQGNCVHLSSVKALAAYPGALAQAPVRDEPSWRLRSTRRECVVNVVWPLTAMNAQSGAIRVWPRSHRSIASRREAERSFESLEIGPGSAVVILGSTLRAAGANRCDEIRRAIVVAYTLEWLMPEERPWVAYPSRIARKFRPETVKLLGGVGFARSDAVRHRQGTALKSQSGSSPLLASRLEHIQTRGRQKSQSKAVEVRDHPPANHDDTGHRPDNQAP